MHHQHFLVKRCELTLMLSDGVITQQQQHLVLRKESKQSCFCASEMNREAPARLFNMRTYCSAMQVRRRYGFESPNLGIELGSYRYLCLTSCSILVIHSVSSALFSRSVLWGFLPVFLYMACFLRFSFSVDIIYTECCIRNARVLSVYSAWWNYSIEKKNVMFWNIRKY